MIHYDPALTLREARDRYFALMGLSDGGYDSPVAVLRAGPIPITVPNTAARVRALRFHDLHHPLTGYDSTWTGEGEIGAWEVASDCADHRAAWALNLLAMAIGLGLAPRRIFRAFVRGRHSRNLYRETFDDALLDETIGGARTRLGLAGETPAASAADGLAFAAWSVIAILLLAVAVAPLGLALAGMVAGARALLG